MAKKFSNFQSMLFYMYWISVFIFIWYECVYGNLDLFPTLSHAPTVWQLYLQCACFPVLVLRWKAPVLKHCLFWPAFLTLVLRVCVSRADCSMPSVHNQKPENLRRIRVRPAGRWRKQQQDLCSVNRNRFCDLRARSGNGTPWVPMTYYSYNKFTTNLSWATGPFHF